MIDPSDTMPTTSEQPRSVTDEAGIRIAIIINIDRYDYLGKGAAEELARGLNALDHMAR